MRTQAGRLLLLAGLLLAGCKLDAPLLRREPPKPPPKPAAVAPAKAPAPVKPDQVTEANAHAKADALDEELARDEQAALQGPGPRPVEKH